jgi:hypothetical protein
MGQVCFEFQRQYRFHHIHHGPCLISLAFLAATSFNSCGCAITSDTLAVGVSSTLVGSHVCCISTITAIARTSDSFPPSSLSQTTVSLEANTPPQQLILQIADGGASNIADILVSPSAFAALGGSPGETSISSVVWMWN